MSQRPPTDADGTITIGPMKGMAKTRPQIVPKAMRVKKFCFKNLTLWRVDHWRLEKGMSSRVSEVGMPARMLNRMVPTGGMRRLRRWSGERN